MKSAFAFCHGFKPGHCPRCNGAFAIESDDAARSRPIKFPDYSIAGTHPATKDLTGQTVAGALVLRRAPSTHGARWLVKAACGHETIHTGTVLRAAAKEGREVRCEKCREKKGGTNG